MVKEILKKDILDRLSIFRTAETALQKTIKSYVQDKNIPLNDRWEIFIKAKMGDHSTMYHHPTGINWSKTSLHDEFYMSRYEIITAVSFVEIAQDNSEEKNYDIDAIKEYFLDEFLWSFENDW